MITKEGKHYILCSEIKEVQSEKSCYKGTKILAFPLHPSLSLGYCRTISTFSYRSSNETLETKWKAWEHALFLGVLWLGLEVGEGREQRTAPSSHFHHPVRPRVEHRDCPESLFAGGNNTIADNRLGLLKRNLKSWEGG